MDYRGQQVFVISDNDDTRIRLVRYLRRGEYETFGLTSESLDRLEHRRNAVCLIDSDFTRAVDALKVGRAVEKPVHFVLFGAQSAVEGFDGVIAGEDEEGDLSVLAYLKDLGAQGHRHFVRFGSQNASIATFEFHKNEKRFAGVIHDISVAGMSCTFKPEPPNPGHLKISDMQLNLPGFRTVLPGQLTVTRKVAGQIIHVFQFSRNLSVEAKDSIYEFIYSSLEMKLSQG